MFITGVFIIVKNYKHLKCPSVDGWTNKKWHIHTMICYSAIKKKEVLIDDLTRMNLEKNMLT